MPNIVGFESHTLAKMIMSYKRIESEARTRHLFIVNDRMPRQKKPSKEAIEVYEKNARRLFIYVACLNSAMVDFETELRNVNMFRHSLKRDFNRVSALVEKISQAFYKSMQKVFGQECCREYNSCMEYASSKIDERLFLNQPEKAYSIVMSLIRLTLKANNGVLHVQEYILGLEHAFKMLDCGLKDYHLDVTIEQALDEVALP